MITREEALSFITTYSKTAIIYIIYADIGTCETCKFYKPLGLNKRLICTKTNTPKDNSGYCDEFEKE